MAKKKKKKVKEFVGTVLRGELFLKFGLHKYLPHILVVFIGFAFTIFVKLKIDDVMIKLEKSTAELETVRILHAQKTCEYVGLEKLGAIQELIEKNNVNVGLPDKPANTIKR